MSLGTGTVIPRGSSQHRLLPFGISPRARAAPRHPLALPGPAGGSCPAARPLPNRAWDPGAAAAGPVFLACAAGSEEKANSHLGQPGLGPMPALPRTPVHPTLTHTGPGPSVPLSIATNQCPSRPRAGRAPPAVVKRSRGHPQLRGQGGAGSCPGQPRRQVLPVFLAPPQRPLLWLPAGAGPALHPGTCRGAAAPVLRSR